MTKQKRRSKKTASKIDMFRNYVWCASFVVISLIALLHYNTGLLGDILYKISRYFNGLLWFVPFIIIIIEVFVYIKNKSLKSQGSFDIITFFVLILIDSLILATFLTITEDITAKQQLTIYFSNQIPSIFVDGPVSGGGMIGTVLYAIINLFAQRTGVVIVMLVVFVIAILVILDDIEDFIKKASEKKKAKQQAKVAKPAPKKKLEEKKPTKQVQTQMNFFDFPDDKDETDEKPKKSLFKKKIDEDTDMNQFAHTATNPKVDTNKSDATSEISLVNSDSVGIASNEKFVLPTLSTLDNVSTPKKNANARNAQEKWQALESVLDDFGLPSQLSSYNIGPSVTQFEIVPTENFNIKKYYNYVENIKFSLAVKDIRIEAPIPGKRAVGIEIPNVERIPVRLKELLQDVPDEYSHEPLLMPLGKDLTGKCSYGLIDKMPHLMIAGATGSGKSVCINSIITTLLLRTTPDEVKLLLIDPKKVEFAGYAKIPHLICPIISNLDQAAGALKKLVTIMENRYSKFEECGVRKLSEYNKQNPTKKMYSIVMIIDELADLMATHGKDVEVYVQRLASMARAAGIYMILATQRPSTDVITGTIKANIPSRIAFAVSSVYDSRTILDRVGAESLFGNGDMLYAPYGSNNPTRIQGVYVSDAEINRVVDYYVKSGYIAHFDDIFMYDEEDESEGSLGEMQLSDPMYKDIEKWVMTQKSISSSGLMRRYSLGFPRAAKILDMLTQNGIISGSNGSKPRDVLVRTENEE